MTGLDGDRAEIAEGHMDQPGQRNGGHRDELGAAAASLRRVPALAVTRLSGTRIRRGGLRWPGEFADDRDGGTSQYGTPFGMAHFECAAAGSGALAIKDGLDTAYVGWNPESDIGNIEIWEQNMPMVYIGCSILPNSGGAGNIAADVPSSPPGSSTRPIICGW